jgi:hypothetical protein
MYEQSKNFESFFIAGFKHWDGAFALPNLKVGQKLKLKPEPDNPYDPNAIAIYRKGTKLGFVPRGQNAVMAQLMHFGHKNVFEAYVLGVDPEADPWKQVYVGVRVKDVRK